MTTRTTSSSKLLVVSAKIDRRLKLRLLDHCEANGLTMSEFVAEAIRAALTMPEAAQLADDIDEAWKRLA